VKALLDTHTLLWAAYRKDLLSARATSILESKSNELIISAASAWEIDTKFRLGRLPYANVLANDFISVVTDAGYEMLSISAEHALRAGQLPGEHKDPFDRMLAAQAIHENIPLISNDTCFDAFGVRRKW